jgi:hypothetical protein
MGTMKARVVRRMLIASVFAFSALVAAAPMAMADPCSPLDLGCVVDDTTTTAGGVVDDTTTTVGGVVDDTTTTVGGVVGGAGPIDPGTILDGVVPGGAVPGGGTLPGTGETPSGGGTTTPNGGGTTHTGTASSGSHHPHAVVVAAGSSSVAPVVSGETSTAVGHPVPTFLDDGGGALVAVAGLVRTLAVPLALILLVIGFLFMQNRIDRKDPKLALAPVGSEHLTFS